MDDNVPDYIFYDDDFADLTDEDFALVFAFASVALIISYIDMIYHLKPKTELPFLEQPKAPEPLLVAPETHVEFPLANRPFSLVTALYKFRLHALSKISVLPVAVALTLVLKILEECKDVSSEEKDLLKSLTVSLSALVLGILLL